MLNDLDVETCARTIREKNGRIKAVLHVLEKPQRDDSAKADAPLSGVPYVLKDSWDTAGIPTTAGSWRHRDRVPSESIPLHQALAKAGAVLLGKSNLPDLAFSHESANHLIGVTSNPHDLSRTAGGSTGGGAAAVASGMAAFDWGSDFAGSIRTPAGYCGVAGIRLSESVWPGSTDQFPRVPDFFAPLQGYGPIARTVDDCRTLTRAMKGLRRDHGTPTIRANEAVIYLPDRWTLGQWASFERDATDAFKREGIAWTIDRELPAASNVNNLYNGYLSAHLDTFQSTGELPTREAVPAILMALASGGRFDRRVHPNTAVLLLLAQVGALTLYRNGRVVDVQVASLREKVRRIWDAGKLIVSPTMTMPPPKHGRSVLDWTAQSFNKFGNLIDATAIAVPFGSYASGLPRSIQVLGPPGSEESVYALAERLERAARKTKSS